MRKRTGICIGIVSGILILGGLAAAAQRVTSRAVNFVTISSLKNGIQEEYVVPDHVDPGQSVEKKVFVKNEGKTDSLVRVKIEKQFGESSEEGLFVHDDSLDPEMIMINYRTDDWKRLPDGYWYYTHVLHAGEITQEPLMESYYLNENVDNRYKKKDARIIVSMESIQAAGEAAASLWGIHDDDLGIKYFPYDHETFTFVNIDEDRKITFQAEGDNLFAGFKELVPGAGRSQTIRITDRAEGNMKLMLRAEASEQEKWDGESRQRVMEILSRYAQIQVKEDGKLLYQGAVDGNLNGSGSSMKDNILLGSFRKGDSKRLVVTLTLDPEVDNRYQKLMGKIDWVFTGEWEEETQHPVTVTPLPNQGTPDPGSDPGRKDSDDSGHISTGIISPKTGDDSQIVPGIILMLIGLVCGAVSFVQIYGKGKHEKKRKK